jgi:seryl-tRNA synthetase
MDVADLDRIDYFGNFPHLAQLTAGLSPKAVKEHYAGSSGIRSVPAEHLQTAQYALPSAACYNVYLDLAGSTIERPLYITTAANCFRRETEFEGLRRLLGFYMREIVCIGDRDTVLDHLANFKERLIGFLAALELPVELAPSTDPFYEADGARAVMQQLFPVKEEILYGGDLAIASLNYHRNFFGERCELRLPDGTHAFSGCVAFGLERWISALTSHFGEDPALLCERLAAEPLTILEET